MTGRQRSGEDSPLARFHQQRRRELVLRRLPVGLLAVLAGAALTWVFVTQPANGSTAAPSGTLLAGPAAAGAGPPALPASAPVPPPAPAAPPAASAASASSDAAPAGAVTGSAASEGAPDSTDPTGPQPPAQRSFSIAVATRGFQHELDQCQWVRMDVGAVAPIVGAHNFCDGDAVLAMNAGDLVAITGTDLDGDFQVTGSRDAHAGDDAATATAGLTADVLLQTCFWEGDALRLVTLRRVDLSLPPTPAPAG